MVAAALRSKIVFQKNEAVVDEYGNHRNVWTDYYSCFATVGGEGLANSKEEQTAGMTVEDAFMTVTVRYCRKTAAVTATEYRVVLDGEIYNIENVDHFGYKKKALKFKCRKARR